MEIIAGAAKDSKGLSTRLREGQPMYKTYVLSVTPRANLDEVEYRVQTDPHIAGYWNYVPFLFCIKTALSAKELAEIFADIAVHGLFIAEIDATNINGRLPKAAWEWFTEPVESEETLTQGFREPSR